MNSIRFDYPKGRVNAIGLYFDFDLLTTNEIKQRVLQQWIIDSDLLEIPHGYLLIWPNPQPVTISQSTGAAILNYGNVYANTLVNKSDIADLEYLGEVFNLYKNGQAIIFPMTDCKRVNPSAWLDISHLTLKKLDSLGQRPSPPTLKQTHLTDSVRGIMKSDKFAASDELKGAISALDGIKSEGQPDAQTGTLGFFASIIRTFKSMKDSSEYPNTHQHSTYGEEQQQKTIWSKINDAFSRNLMASKLGNVIGRAQAKYVQNMLDKFDHGDIHDALKNAIPLGSMQDALTNSRPSLGKPGAFTSLNIQTHRAASSRSFSIEDRFLEHLRNLYESTFKKLDRIGQYKEASFVLAELLRDISRAVSYLEKHQQYELAAELAEGQKLPPARIIRQWILAGNIDRALNIMRISGCYEEAITALENDHKSAANKLRWDLANMHREAGNYDMACELAWPIVEKREDVLEWMQTIASTHSPSGVKQLIRLAVHDLNNSKNHLLKVQEIAQSNTTMAPQLRLELIDELMQINTTEESKIASSIMLRAYLRDVSKGVINHNTKRWRALCTLSGDLALRADSRNLSFNPNLTLPVLNTASAPITLDIAKGMGRTPLDVGIFCDGSLLVAFGESGVEVWSSEGKKLRSFFIPCHHIVVSDNGNKALLIGSREEHQVIHKFNKHKLAVDFWFDLSVTCWADSYDGVTWIIGNGDALWVIDAQEKTPKAVWSIDDLGGPVISIKRTRRKFSFVFQKAESFEIWNYALPNLYLKERTPYQTIDIKNMALRDYNIDGLLAALNEEDKSQFAAFKSGQSPLWQTLNNVQTLFVFDQWLLATSLKDSQACCHFYDLKNDQVKELRLTARFENNMDTKARKLGHIVVLWREDGRICVINTENGRLLGSYSI